MDVSSVVDLVTSTPAVITLAAGAIDLLLRKHPQGVPLLRIAASVLLFVDKLLSAVPGLANVEPAKKGRK